MVYSYSVYFNIFLIDCSRILNFASIIFNERMWDVALAPAIIIISGSTFHPLFLMLFIMLDIFLLLK